jgi:hypothetical protein
VGPETHGYALIYVSCIGNGYPDPNPEGQILPSEIEKDEEILCFELLVLLFRGLDASSPAAWTSFVGA